MPELKRLQVVIAACGIASRRASEELIKQGRVRVNGIVVTKLGTKVDPIKDKVEVNGRPLKSPENIAKLYYVFYKPLGVTTTLSDPHAKRTIADFTKDVPDRLYPVGRLDQDSTGLLLLTNDGELAHRLTHPSFGAKKYYRVVVDRKLSYEELGRLRHGVTLKEGKTAPSEVKEAHQKPKGFEFLIVLHEGKNRQIRRMIEKIGAEVLSLHREAYGPILLGDLKPGEKRVLAKSEVKQLRSLVGLSN